MKLTSKIALGLLLFFLGTYPIFGEEKINGFVINPQKVEFAFYNDKLFPSSFNIDLLCVGHEVLFTKEIGNQKISYQCNFNCNTTNFEWQVITEKPWALFNPSRGSGRTLSKLNLTIDPDLLKNSLLEDCDGISCFKNGVTFRITYYLNDCIAYSDNSTFLTGVVYYTEQNFPDFIKIYYTKNSPPLKIIPSQIKFETNLENFSPLSAKIINIQSSHLGWDYNYFMPWIEIDESENLLSIKPSNILNPGKYLSFLLIKDLSSNLEQLVPITINIANNSANAKFFYAIYSHKYSSDYIEVSTGHWLNINFNLDPFVDDLPIYIEVSHSSFPNYIFSYRNFGQPYFELVYYDGQFISNIDQKFYIFDNPEKLIRFGPIHLIGLEGLANIKIKQGENWKNSRTLFDLKVIIRSLNGTWKIVDLYNNQQYEHPFPLVVKESSGLLVASWGDYNPKIYYSTDPNSLYEIKFKKDDFYYCYQITSLTENKIEGMWSYSTDGYNYSTPEPFYGIKIGH